MAVSYSRQTVDNPNPLARFAHRARTAGALTTAAGLTPEGGRVVDYGCGPATFLRDLGGRRPDLKLTGYDPYFAEGQVPGVDMTGDMAAVPDGSVDLFTAFETCEHLDDGELAEFLAHADRALAAPGRLLISVPIIGGPGLLAKELNRILLHRRRSDYTARELVAAVVLGRPAARAGNVKTTHKGFDFRALRATVGGHFTLEREWLSPFSALPWPANSQHFSVWRRR